MLMCFLEATQASQRQKSSTFFHSAGDILGWDPLATYAVVFEMVLMKERFVRETAGTGSGRKLLPGVWERSICKKLKKK